MAFKREYRNLYRQEIDRTQEYIEVKKDVLECLEELKENNSGKKREYIRKFANKIKKAENDFGDRMNELRNDSAHGNIDLEIKPIHVSDFSILEELLYAMRLKAMKVDVINIRRAIKSLKNYSIIIDED